MPCAPGRRRDQTIGTVSQACLEVWSPLSYCPRSSLSAAVLAWLAARLAQLLPSRPPGTGGRVWLVVGENGPGGQGGDGDGVQADQAEDLLHPGPGDAVAAGLGEQVVAGAAARVDRPGVQQGPTTRRGA